MVSEKLVVADIPVFEVIGQVQVEVVLGETLSPPPLGFRAELRMIALSGEFQFW